MSRQKDEQAEARWLAIQDELSPGETRLDRMASDLATMAAGLHRVRNEKGQWAYFPNVPHYPSNKPAQRDLEDAWEAGAIRMHENQQPLAPLPAKVSGEAPAGEGGFVIRGQVANVPPQGIPNFHESPASTETQRRQVKRGD